MYYNMLKYIFIYYNMLDTKYNFLLFLLLVCIVKVFNISDLFIINEHFFGCNRSQKRKKSRLDSEKNDAINKRVDIETSGQFQDAVDELQGLATQNKAVAINNEYTKEYIKDIYDKIYDNLYIRVGIDNDSIVKSNKNVFMDRAEVILGDLNLSKIPDYAE